jgi:hypothetical protein
MSEAEYISTGEVPESSAFYHYGLAMEFLGCKDNFWWLCGLVKYTSLYGAAIGYTITASLSMVAIERSNCFHKNGHDALCDFSNNNFTILFGFAEMILSQIPNFDQAWWISVAAAHTCYLVAEANFE